MFDFMQIREGVYWVFVTIVFGLWGTVRWLRGEDWRRFILFGAAFWLLAWLARIWWIPLRFEFRPGTDQDYYWQHGFLPFRYWIWYAGFVRSGDPQLVQSSGEALSVMIRSSVRDFAVLMLSSLAAFLSRRGRTGPVWLTLVTTVLIISGLGTVMLFLHFRTDRFDSSIYLFQAAGLICGWRLARAVERRHGKMPAWRGLEVDDVRDDTSADP